MWPYNCVILFFYRTPAIFFGDVTIYIYDSSTALEPHIVECDTRFMRFESYRPLYEEESNFAFLPSQLRHSAA